MKKSFSLIEVVLACTVLILFLMAGLILFGTGIRNVEIAKHRLTATYLANQKLEEKRLEKDNSSPYFGTVAWAAPAITNPCPAATFLTTLDGIPYNYSLCVSQGPFAGTDRKLAATISWTDFSKTYSITSYTYLVNWQN